MEVDAGLGPQPADEGDGIFEAGNPVGGVESEGRVGFTVPAYSHSQDEPTSRDLVQARRYLGHIHGIVVGKDDDGDAELDGSGAGGGESEEGERVQVGTGGKDAMLGPDAFIAELLDEGQVLPYEAQVRRPGREHLGNGNADGGAVSYY